MVQCWIRIRAAWAKYCPLIIIKKNWQGEGGGDSILILGLVCVRSVVGDTQCCCLPFLTLWGKYIVITKEPHRREKKVCVRVCVCVWGVVFSSFSPMMVIICLSHMKYICQLLISRIGTFLFVTSYEFESQQCWQQNNMIRCVK